MNQYHVLRDMDSAHWRDNREWDASINLTQRTSETWMLQSIAASGDRGNQMAALALRWVSIQENDSNTINAILNINTLIHEIYDFYSSLVREKKAY